MTATRTPRTTVPRTVQPISYEGFLTHNLGDGHLFHCGRLPECLTLDQPQFENLWSLHPPLYHRIKMHGHEVDTPRWQQAFGTDYHYTGRVNKALPVPAMLEPFLVWAQAALDRALNGILVNWYSGQLGHYIGAHRDSRKHMIVGAPIVTISFGEDRIFRLRPWKGTGCRDFPATAGTVFVMPYDTNLTWTHEVPDFAKYQGRRISVTLRAFEGGVLHDVSGE